ncbi:hypothetical protein Salat_1464500 [Sesamum alatum]|uniref:CCHC-type domain-containing protein n=1 Tax=Sesamum alatum TaxID=300844 RepID=A0AAE1YBJ4_9LAMI|nr:hypothetical protein Salat_1464500 [Sesamum alatum]
MASTSGQSGNIVPDLNRLGDSLILTEDEDSGFVMSSGVWHVDPMVPGFLVVAGLLSVRSFHPDALQTALLTSFNPVRGMEFKMLEGDRFLSKFFHAIDQQRVLAGLPWAFNNNLFILAPVEPTDNLSFLNLDWCEFHIHIHGLPIGKMTKKVDSWIGNRLGKLKKVDMGPNGIMWGLSIRIRVAIDTTKPLRHVLKIRTILGDEQLVTFIYERLPNFCYFCGHLGHISRACELQFDDGFVDLGTTPRLALGFGPPPQQFQDVV